MIKNNLLLVLIITLCYEIYPSAEKFAESPSEFSAEALTQLQRIITSCKNANQFTTLSNGVVVIDTTEYQAKLVSQTDSDKYTTELFKISFAPFILSEKIDPVDIDQLESCVLNKPGRNYMIKVSDKKGNMHKGYFTEQPDEEQAQKYIKIAIQKIKTKNQ